MHVRLNSSSKFKCEHECLSLKDPVMNLFTSHLMTAKDRHQLRENQELVVLENENTRVYNNYLILNY